MTIWRLMNNAKAANTLELFLTDPDKAIEWMEHLKYPKDRELLCGIMNLRLVNTINEAAAKKILVSEEPELVKEVLRTGPDRFYCVSQYLYSLYRGKISITTTVRNILAGEDLCSSLLHGFLRLLNNRLCKETLL